MYNMIYPRNYGSKKLSKNSVNYFMQESESEDEGLDEIDDENDEENDHELEMAAEKELVVQKPAEKELVVPKDDIQLSKKELKKKEVKKKELAELEAVLAKFRLAESSRQEYSPGKNLYVLLCLHTRSKQKSYIYIHCYNLELLVYLTLPIKCKMHLNTTNFALVLSVTKIF